MEHATVSIIASINQINQIFNLFVWDGVALSIQATGSCIIYPFKLYIYNLNGLKTNKNKYKSINPGMLRKKYSK